jgi:S1-C subfamily serine protease
MTSKERAERGLEGNYGILLEGVYENEPAARSGLREDDVILSINGEQIVTRRQALLIAAASKPGDELEIVAWRDGAEFRTTVIATERGEQPVLD